ncbi:MAG: phytoene desaturase family protein, partial [Phycisphaerae bacterium]|nr:phytoene desaturase family protein [Phycisphaerae bacterium]MDW8262654.1 phytoene desaturase family protein [Phycisphaerales bacterium]
DGHRWNPLRGLGLLTTPFRIGMFSNFARLVDRHISSAKLRSVLYQYATYSGASPFRAPATLVVIPFVEMYFGGWYPPGGMYQLAIKLAELARSLGVEIRTGSPVSRICVQNSRTGRRPVVAGVKLADGTELPADAVVCNSDVVYAYRNLIDPRFRPHFPDRRLDALEPGGSGMVLLLGVEGEYPQLDHHTKFMPADYASELRAMFDTRTIPEDPCIYVCASTRTDPSQAPDGCENLFVLCSAPPLDGRLNWDLEGPRYEAQILRALEEQCGLSNLRKRIVVKRRLTPVDLERDYHANAGSIYGIGSNSRRAAFLRPPNRDRHIRGLFFAGGATHPGGGLPLVALSGKIAAELVLEYVGQPVP